MLSGILIAGVVGLGWLSLHTFDQVQGLPGPFSFTQYSQTFRDPLFVTDLRRTVIMAVVASLIAVALALPFTRAMAHSTSRFVRLTLIVVVFVPFLTGDITRTYGWLVILGPDGPLAWFCDKIGLAAPQTLGTLWAVGLGLIQVLLPIAVIILLPAVLRIDPTLEDAASTLGANRRAVVRTIVLPQLRTPIVGAFATCFALGAADFADPAILGQGLNDFLGNLLQDRYLSLSDAPAGAAIGILLLVLVTVATALILGINALSDRR